MKLHYLWNLLFVMLLPLSVSAKEADHGLTSVVGFWKSSNADQALERYRAVYVNKYDTVKMIDCVMATDAHGEKLNAVICDATPKLGVSLKYNAETDSFKVVNQGLSKIKVEADLMHEEKLWGLGGTTWKKVDSDLHFMFVNGDFN